MFINILGVKYELQECTDVSKYEPCRGQIDYMRGIIRLDESMCTTMKRQVLMHEVLHAILDLIGMDDLNVDESKVQALATALYQVVYLRDEIFSQD